MKLYLFYVYILATTSNRVLYTGMTNDLERRCKEHKGKYSKGFTSRYNVNKLIYYETFNDVEDAIKREKQIKAYSRRKKDELINHFNSTWENLFINGRIIKPKSLSQ